MPRRSQTPPPSDSSSWLAAKTNSARPPLLRRGPYHAKRRAADPVGNGGTRHEEKPAALVEVARRIVMPDTQTQADAAPRRFGNQCAQQSFAHALAAGSLAYPD